MRGYRLTTALVILAAALSITSCGGGGGSSGSAVSTANNSATPGQVMMAVTDAPGDFLSYEVTVDSITLSSTDGTEVQTIPIASRIDFTQYTDMSELFNVLTIPAGTYSKVQLNLDYTNATIIIEGNNGEEIAPIVVDEGGAAVGKISLILQFSNNEALTVRAGETAQLSIDFNLDSSNEVDVDNKIVTVGPVLYATTTLDQTREHRVRGLLDAVSIPDSTFKVDLLPLYLSRGNFGMVVVHSDDNTKWVIDGVSFTGTAGLQQLAQLKQDTPIVVFGSVSSAGVVANQVYAGTSVPWVGRDAVQGVVIARVEDQLQVRGRVIEVNDNTAVFSSFQTVTVNLSPETAVTREVLDSTGLTIDAISVGQRVTVFGQLAQAQPKISGAVMDATAGQVHMEINQVEGEVTYKDINKDAVIDPLVMALDKINGRSPQIFDFSGTGGAVGDNVDPTNFEIATGLLNLSNIDVDEFVKVRGYFNNFGEAPPDFIAQTIVDPNQSFNDHVLAYWNPSQNTDAIISIANDSVLLNTDETKHGVLFVQVSHNGVVTADPTTLRLVADPDGKGSYAVKSFRDHQMDVIDSFAGFEAQISARDQQGQKLVSIEATGRYNEQTASFEVSNAVAVFKRDHGYSPNWDTANNPGKHKGQDERNHGKGHGNPQ